MTTLLKGHFSVTQVEHILGKNNRESPVRVLNFAFPGATVEDDLPSQLSSFKRSLGEVTLGSERTAYCALTVAPGTIETLVT